MRTAIALDPLRYVISNDEPVLLYAAGRFDEAAERCRRTLLARPGFFPAHYLLGCIRAAQGRLDQAAEEFGIAESAAGRPVQVLARHGYVLAKQGRTGQAAALRTEIERSSRGPCLTDLALLRFQLGDREGARACLESAAGARSVDLLYAGLDPLFGDLKKSGLYALVLDRARLLPR